jgi:hypothetical protein
MRSRFGDPMKLGPAFSYSWLLIVLGAIVWFALAAALGYAAIT